MAAGAGAEFGRLARACRDAANRDLRLELNRAVRSGGDLIRREGRRSAMESLPQSGGLAARIAGANYSTRRRTGSNPGVVVVATLRQEPGAESGREVRKVDLRALDRGRARHPTYGHLPWVTQRVPARWWTDACQETGQLAADIVARGMEDVAEKLARRAGGQ